MPAAMPADLMAIITVVAVLVPAGVILYKKKPALFTAENILKLLDFSVKVLEKVFAILKIIKKITDIAVEILEAYNKIKKAQKAAQAQWKLQYYLTIDVPECFGKVVTIGDAGWARPGEYDSINYPDNDIIKI
ncbi:hypothetical protein BO70DRAFT_432148, partial [Aspergillus heteromorphus CBS 117.55]